MAEDAREIASQIVRQLLERSERGGNIDSLAPPQKKQLEEFTDTFTRMLIDTQSIFLFTAPQQLHECKMPNNSEFDYLHNMKNCPSCNNKYCRKHNLVHCVSCGTAL